MSVSKVQPPSGETSVDNSSKTFINILLLGETGVGKSTFINSFANYVQHETIEDARKSDLLCLIPTQFTVTDENYESKVVKFGENENEDRGIGSSKTQRPRSYTFPSDDNQEIRIIDTPGIGDVRGIKQDNENFENILGFLGHYEYLHAICILLKPDVTRLSASFEYCFFHLLSRLDKSAEQNIIFIFTNTRSTSYRPTETMPLLKQLLQKIEKDPPHVKIPCDKRNIFCMDNEAFRFLIALRNDCTFSSEEIKRFSSSWEVSVQTCYEILDYVSGKESCIKPHLIRNTLSVNDVRRVINNLYKPLSEICNLIHENLAKLEERKKEIELEGQNLREFEKKLYIPKVILHRIKLDHPKTVCASAKCIERKIVNGKVHIQYKTICHEKCNVPFASTEFIGPYMLFFCSAMDFGTCKNCKCSFEEHTHIYYDLETEDVEEQDETVAQDIGTTLSQIRIQRKFIEKLQVKMSEYEAERDVINKCLAKFAYFLKDHAIAIFNDAYENYLDYLIERETSFGSKANQNFIDKHVTFKKQYLEEKRLLEALLQSPTEGNPHEVTVNEVHDLIGQLYNLKHTGEKIKELHLAQETMRIKATEANTEYFHPKKILRKTAYVLKTMAKTALYNPVASALNKATTLIGNVSITGTTTNFQNDVISVDFDSSNTSTSSRDDKSTSVDDGWTKIDECKEM